MIVANELRIGNWVYIGHMNGRINERSFNDTTIFDPIPITEEWLLKFGFDRMEKFPLRYVNRIKDDSLTDFEPVIVNGDMWLKNLKYVHQLQNLYFALTQTELEIK